MKPSIRIGRIFGVEVGVHWSVLVIAGLLAFGLTGGELDGALWAVAIFAVVFFLASLAHELAHSVIAERNGMEVKGITLWLLGGVAQLGGPMPSAGAELRIAAAGPATSVALGAGFLVLAVAGAASGVISSLIVSAFAWLAFVNVLLAVFNLIPAAPLDGGRILAALLWMRTGDRTRADIAATRAGQVFGFAMIAAGVAATFVDIPFVTLWTAFLGWFIVTTATAERRHAQMTRGFGELRGARRHDPEPRDDPRLDHDRRVCRRRATRAAAPSHLPGRGVGWWDQRDRHARRDPGCPARGAADDACAGRRAAHVARRHRDPRRATDRCGEQAGGRSAALRPRVHRGAAGGRARRHPHRG